FCPKVVGCGRNVAEIAAYLGTCVYNDGQSSLVSVAKKLDLLINKKMKMHFQILDKLRIKKAEKRDLHTIDLEDFQYSRANITGFKIVETESALYEELLNETNFRLLRWKADTVDSLSTTSAMLYDAVVLFSKALQDLDNGKYVEKFPIISCDDISKGTDGTSIINYMKSNKIRGLTGLVHFDGQGFRSSFSLDILQLSRQGLKKIGAILPGRYINITDIIEPEITNQYSLEHRKYVITTIL
ncbi:glutamate receptor ionotropic, kainate 2, partial [Nephila pilipes]